MARLEKSIKHNQHPDVVHTNFRKGIEEAQARHATWIHKVEWSPDGRVATLNGPGFTVDLTCDEEFVHARGAIPLMLKLMEGSILRYVASVLERQAAEQAASDGPSAGA